MTPWVLLAIYCAMIVGASVLGGLIPLLIRLTHRRMELLVSFVAGVMLGVALFSLLPHALESAAQSGEARAQVDRSVLAWVLVGLLAMFLIERFFHFHSHDAPHQEAEPQGQAHHHELTWAGAAIGLGLHSVFAGVALGAAVFAGNDEGTRLSGLGVFLAIFLHKPFDAVALGTLMAVGPWSRPSRHFVNLAFGLAVPAGVVAFALGLSRFDNAHTVVLAFSAGTFLVIALSDLLPEVRFHRHDRVMLSAALLSGLAVAWAAATFEQSMHDPPQPLTTASRWLSSAGHATHGNQHRYCDFNPRLRARPASAHPER